MIVVVGLILALILVLIFSNRRTRQCRWRRQGPKGADGATPYKCMACGAQTQTTTATAPDICLRDRQDG